MRNFTFFLVAIVLTGCAAGPPQSYPATSASRLAVLAKATPCCDDPSGFQFAALPQRGVADADLGRMTPVFDFHSGLSPFVAFELPQQTSPYRVRIKSLFNPKDGGASGVFYPVVALLDEAFIVVHMTGVDNLRLEPALATPGGAAGLSVSLAIDPADQQGKYLVVFTPAVLLGAQPDLRREGDMLTPPTLAWLERRGDTVIPPSPYGHLKITVAPDQPVATAGAAEHSRSN
jgi:maltose operon substrate-binding protein precursor MalM